MNQRAQSTPKTTAPPGRIGLYDPALEHDNCGLALITRFKGGPDHAVITQALDALRRLEHRGGIGSDDGTGDGAGLTIQIPHDYFSARLGESGISLPQPGTYAMGIGFFAQDYATDLNAVMAPLTTETQPDFSREDAGDDQDALVSRIAAEEGLQVIHAEPVAVDPGVLGRIAADTMPSMRYVFFGLDAGYPARDEGDLARRAFIVRKRLDNAGLYFPSLSTTTLTYKGMLSTGQLSGFYTELNDERLTSRIALVHSRF